MDRIYILLLIILIRKGGSDIYYVFAKILKNGGSIKVLTMVTWPLAALLSSDPNSQDHFTQGSIRSLAGHLAPFSIRETILPYPIGDGHLFSFKYDNQ